MNYQPIMNLILLQYNLLHNEVSKILQNMGSDSSTSHDSSPIKFLKYVADDISLPLTNIINNSIQMNVFPAQWKIGRNVLFPKLEILYR